MTTYSSAARAQDAQQSFDSLYGADLKRVAQTTDTRDDLELAGQLLTAAGKSASQPELLTLLCEKAYQLSNKAPTGYPIAVGAMELLAKQVPAKQAACREKLIALHQARAASGAASPADRQAAGEELVDLFQDAAEDKAEAGEWPAAVEMMRKALATAETVRSPVKDEIRIRLNELAARERLEKEIADLKARIKGSEADNTARERLVRIYLVDLDRPEEAAKFVSAGIADEALRTYVPLAAKPLDELVDTVVLELGQWYRGLAEKAAPTAQVAMYERARACYSVYLKKHTTDDLARTQARLTLDSIETALARLNSNVDTTGWADVLALVDVGKHCTGGKWQRQEQRLLVDAVDPAWGAIPVLPDGSYSLQVKFTRTAGAGPMSIALPIGGAACALTLGAGSEAGHGLHMVGGKPADDNATTVRPGKLENGKEYTLNVKVMVRGKQLSVSSTLSGQKCVQWEGTAGELSLEPWATLFGKRSLGFAVPSGAVTFSSAKMRLLSGGAQLVEEPKPADPGDNRPRWGDNRGAGSRIQRSFRGGGRGR